MAEKIRFVILGGSSIASPELVDSLMDSAGQRPPIEVVLHGRTQQKLEMVGGICQRMVGGRGVDLEVSYTTDVEEALEGADYVLNQIRVGGLQARAFDETFPHEFGIPGEETVGPGGFNNSLRTIPVVLERCQVIERVAPNALMLNLTNPNSVIQYAVTRYSKVNIVGVCNSPLDLELYVADLLDTPMSELSLDYVGLHHFGFIVGARHDGQDVMDRVLERVAEVDDLGIDLEIVLAQRAVPGSYLRYFYHPDRMLAKQKGKPARATQLLELQDSILSEYADWTGEQKPEALAKRGAGWYAKIVTPVLLAVINDTQERAIVNVVNGKTVPYLAERAIVEVDCTIGAEGAKPVGGVAEPPPDIKAMIQVNSAYEMLAAEGIAERDRNRALRALLLSPLVPSADAARGVLERIWPDSE
jgi:6-phospho-beta-glucosidase